ncbi:hypothetical protein KAE78_12525 [Microbacterium sp. NIBRBAC000506063]|nr:hypothetical protein [Microbacterium sp. NIBRBAC000506063]QTV79634.1 hypothetical protein KAE78_12525 [Microbacterium sp. NIBRBAC000506063]
MPRRARRRRSPRPRPGDDRRELVDVVLPDEAGREEFEPGELRLLGIELLEGQLAGIRPRHDDEVDETHSAPVDLLVESLEHGLRQARRLELHHIELHGAERERREHDPSSLRR